MCKIDKNKLFSYEELKNKTTDIKGVLRPEILFVDIDNEKYVEPYLNIINTYNIKTAVIKTSRGIHSYFKNNGDYSKKLTTYNSHVGLEHELIACRDNSTVTDNVTENQLAREWILECDELDNIPWYFAPNKGNTKFDGNNRNNYFRDLMIPIKSEGKTYYEFKEVAEIINHCIIQGPLNYKEFVVATRKELWDGVSCNNVREKKPHVLLGDSIISKINLKYDGIETYTYKDGWYQKIDRTTLNQFIRNENTNVTISQVEETARYIMEHPTVYIKHDDFNKCNDLINLKNGVYNINTDELLPHSPTYPFNYIINADYNKNKVCAGLENLLNKTIGEQRIVLEEFLGYAFMDTEKYNFEKALLFLGTSAGGNGKSTILTMIRHFFGESATAFSLDGISHNKFEKYNIRGKRLIIDCDYNQRELQDTGIIKSIISGDPIMFEKKNHQGQMGIPQAKVIVACNSFPKISSQQTGGNARRWDVINFSMEISAENRDYNIKHEIKKQEYMSALLNLAIAGYKRLIANGKFSVLETSEELKKRWDYGNDSFQSFIGEYFNITRDLEDKVKKQELYKLYQGYCSYAGVKPLGLHNFYNRVLSIRGIKETMINNKRHFLGMKRNDMELPAEVYILDERG